MIASLTIRPLRATDIPALVDVLARAFESRQSFSLRLNAYLACRDVATFVADLEGTPVGMVVGNDYGPVAYVAQMAVDPAVQRRGIGSALMDALIGWADRRGFAAVELDATLAGAPLYARYGFVADGETLVFAAGSRGGVERGVRRFAAGDFAAIAAADARVFGADRSDVLRQIVAAEHNVVFVAGISGSPDAFAVAQRGSEQLGPVVAPSAEAAARLIDAARAALPAGHRLCVPSANAAAQPLAMRGDIV